MLQLLVLLSFLCLLAQGQTYVTRKGNQLYIGDKAFRFAGTNIYWLGLDENVGGVNYPTNFRISDALETVVAMGGSVVRGHTLGVSTGNPKSFEPALGKFNHSALDSADYAIAQAGTLGLKLVIPLTDNYRYYHGGKHDFTDWRGISDENQFYVNTQVISDFKNYIQELFNHVNKYNGIVNKVNPTIMAWETGNEIRPPVAWTREISDYIKSIDPNHLVLDGNYGVNKDALSFPNVDLYSNHYYPMRPEQISQDASACTAASKVYFVGEFGWSSGSNLADFLTAIEKNAVAADTYWSLFPHLDTYGWEQHNDGFTLHFPTGNSPQQQNLVQSLRTHAFKMRDLPVPQQVLPPAPVITLLRSGAIGWRGSVAASTYSVERSSSSTGPWTTICNKCASDNNTPWQNGQVESGNWYRVIPYNLDNMSGNYSTPVKI